MFVRPFQTEDKIMRIFNAHGPSWLGRAMEPVLNTGLGALQLDEPESLFNIRKPRRFVAVRWKGGAPILGNIFLALRLYAKKTNCEAHCCFSYASIPVRTIL